MIRKRKILVVGAIGAAVVLGLASPASATEGEFVVIVGQRDCNIYEEVELQGGHDYMMWQTYAASAGCDVYIYDNREAIEHQHISDGGYHHSAWYYDGPGHLAQVCAIYDSLPPEYDCGPFN